MATVGLRRRFRDIALNLERQDMFLAREDLARRYLAGEGIEIGPLMFPLRVPPGARVRNVDRLSRDELMDVYRGIVPNPEWIPEIHIVDDGERLATVAENTLDFVIANHVLEHIEDPIGALRHWLRVIRPHGTLFITLPDPRRTFDALRPRTTVEHLLRDHREGPQSSRDEHYREWARVECLPQEQATLRVAELARQDARHHFHVWELEDFLRFVFEAQLPWKLEHAQNSFEEFIVILRKTT
jgi:SAM-dependent methyltransferase